MAKRDKLTSTDSAEIESLRERVRARDLSEREWLLLERLLGLLLSLLTLVEEKNFTIKRLKRALFGPSSDSRAASPREAASEGDTTTSSSESPSRPSTGAAKTKPRGHGRIPASRFTGAQTVRCEDPVYAPRARCPDPHCTGHLYDTRSPQIFIRRTGQPIISATRYEQQVLRCSACQARHVAPLPVGVAPERWDATADVAIGLAKYGTGLPWYRIEQAQAGFGVPLPASTAFERCERVADAALPIYLLLRRLAASSPLFYVDDTSARILACKAENKTLPEKARKGQYTTGILAEMGLHRIVLYETGRKVAGENLDEVLGLREEGLEPAKQMSDALPANWPKRFVTIVIKCLAHARRPFVELEKAFPEPCRRVLDDLARIYAAEEACRGNGLTGAARLAYHQRESEPVMEALRIWIEGWLEEQDEPNSRLGRALRYLLKHWAGLTQFLRVEDAPLDNNVCERVLKRAVLHRKNALFFKTQHGADVGDMWLTLIETCRQNEVNAFEYLVAVVRNERAVREDPRAWLPWSYRGAGSERAAA